MEFNPSFFAGGLKCLDFCNTFDHLHPSPAYDFLPDRATLLQWGQAAGILPPGFQDNPVADGQFFTRALEARALIFHLFIPFVRSGMPAEADVALFNTFLQDVSTRLEVVSTANGYELACRAADPLERILCEVMRSAADLLISNQLERVRQCEECGWLFYDSTRNRSRRWCDMKLCGNKAKARRHYERVKQKKMATI